MVSKSGNVLAGSLAWITGSRPPVSGACSVNSVSASTSRVSQGRIRRPSANDLAGVYRQGKSSS
jgi:hypothetical protein